MEPNKTSLLYVEVKNKLIEHIATMEPNDRLSSRNELVNKYKVARTTIERAISELIGEGYLYARDGSGTYVADRSLPAAAKANSATWGLVIPDIMNDVYPALLRAVEDAANRNGVHLIICNTDNQSEKQSNYINKLIDSNVQGLVIVPVIDNQPDIAPFTRLAQMEIPFIFCNRSVVGVEAPLVTTNNFYGAYRATKYLLEAGYRNVSYISHPLYSVSMERYQGYISALGEAGLELDPALIVFGESFTQERPGYQEALRLLAGDSRPDAFFCFNDHLATGVYEAIIEQGLKVGAEVGLIGYGNNHVCEKLPVKLTSVNYDSYKIGQEAGELLLQSIRGEYVSPNKLVILHPELIVRSSSEKKIVITSHTG